MLPEGIVQPTVIQWLKTYAMKIEKIYTSMEYGPAVENKDIALQWIQSHQSQFGLFINNKWKKPHGGEYFDSINPCTKEKLATISQAGHEDINDAVQAAKMALPAWNKIGAHQRARFLYAIARKIQKHARLLAVLESLDNGKPIRETRDIDIPLVSRHFYHHAGWAQIKQADLKNYHPIGVVGQIIPWNFPLLMLAWKIAPALAMGNTVILKPAEFTSLTALFFAEICQEINLPAGVINIVTGDGKTGSSLVKHADVQKIAFTGSTVVGRLIRKSTAGTGKQISLELGGKSPFLVFEDADLDSAVEGIVDAIWFNQGQVCCAGSRLLVQESIAEQFYAKVKARMEQLRVGDSLDKNTDIGAIIAPVQLQKIENLVKQGILEGGILWQPSWNCPQNGYYYPPSLFTDVSPSDTITQEEIFGPVLVAMRFRNHQEAVKLANNTRFGLAASIWTENINLALDLAPQIKAGTVWINCTNVFDAASGFGGYKESGFGREGGLEGLFEYLKFSSNETSSTPDPIHEHDNETVMNFGPTIDRTPKLYIGGQQVRPDGGYSRKVYSRLGNYLGEVPQGNRKDIRNAVEAAHADSKWKNMTGHARAQVLYFVAENLSVRQQEFSRRIAEMLDCNPGYSSQEVSKSIERLYYYAAMADKYDGRVHHTIHRYVTLAMPEPLGVMGVICPENNPLLGFISTVLPALAMGNRVIAIPSQAYPFSATDFYQILETSDVPNGALNIVTGSSIELSEVLAKHNDLEGIWYFGESSAAKNVEYHSAENLKRTWIDKESNNWFNNLSGQGELYLRKATQIKNIWIPYGV